MTPAINSLKKAKISYRVHEYEHDPAAESYGVEAAEKLQIDPSRICKTLVVELQDGSLAVGIIPVLSKLNLKGLAKTAGSKKAKMANPADVERTTGYVLGGVSPIGQKKRLLTVIDETAEKQKTIFISGGRRGLDIELEPAALRKITGGSYAAIGQYS